MGHRGRNLYIQQHIGLDDWNAFRMTGEHVYIKNYCNLSCPVRLIFRMRNGAELHSFWLFPGAFVAFLLPAAHLRTTRRPPGTHEAQRMIE